MSLLGAGPSALEGQGKGCTWVETEELTLGGLSVLMEHKAVSFRGSSKGHSKGGGGGHASNLLSNGSETKYVYKTK